jgi:hypothetical protein
MQQVQCNATHTHTHTHTQNCPVVLVKNTIIIFLCLAKKHTQSVHTSLSEKHGKITSLHLPGKKNPHSMLLAEKLERELLAKLPSLHKLVLQPLFETTSSSCTRTRSSKWLHKSNSVPN